jgi:hypothetical protein
MQAKRNSKNRMVVAWQFIATKKINSAKVTFLHNNKSEGVPVNFS